MSFFFPETDSEETKNNWRLKSEWQRPQAFLFTHLFSEKCKITCVVWQDDTSVAAATDDGTAKLFKLQNGTLKVLQSHTTHRELSRDKFRINAIAVTKDFKVITGDDYGNLVIWDTFAKQTRCLTLSKNTILVMKAHPEHPGVIGSVQLTFEMMFIFYARWRFKKVCGSVYQLGFSFKLARFARKRI